MNPKELRTIKDACKRLMPGLKVEEVSELPGALRIVVPYHKASKIYSQMYFFVGKQKTGRRFNMLIPVESIGLVATNSTLATLQPLLKDYGLILTEDAVIIEENVSLPLEERLGNMVRMLIAVDGIRRLWIIESNRRQDGSEGQDPQPTSNRPDDRPSR